MRVGVSYYPELVKEAEWPTDVAGMRAAGMTVVRMLDFAWSSIEPREGEYRLEWVDRFLDLAQREGMAVVLCTPTASPPAWLIRKHPEMMVELRSGERLRYGERRAACVNSTPYRDHSTRIARVLGERYGSHPAVIGWQIDNELIGPEIERFECHCAECQVRFREWLRARYASLEELNTRWMLKFWSLEFSDWDEVGTPRGRRACDGHVLDAFRFYNDSLVAYCAMQARTLRAVIVPRQFISHNATGVFDRGINHRDFARVLDVTGWDAYRGAAGNQHPSREAFTALAHDLFRSALRKPFWIFETNTDDTLTPAFLAEMRAHGAEAMLFWHWRRHRGNMEKTCAALCDYAGRPNARRLALIRRTVERLEETPPLPETLELRRAAILFAADCVRLQHRWPIRPLPYLNALIQAYEPFWRHGVGMDVVNPGDDLSAYRLVVIPSLQVVSEEQAGGLRRFVQSGGLVLFTAKTAHQDLHGVFHAGGPGAPLSDVTGARLRDDEPRGEAPRVRLPNGTTCDCDPWYERPEAVDGEILASFVGSDVDGLPAAWQRSYGRGTVVYAAAVCRPLVAWLARMAAEKARLPWTEHHLEQVAVLPELAGRGSWIFNHTPSPVTIGDISVPAGDFAWLPAQAMR